GRTPRPGRQSAAPPSLACCSTSATDAPSHRAARAAANPAVPPPTTTTSKSALDRTDAPGSRARAMASRLYPRRVPASTPRLETTKGTTKLSAILTPVATETFPWARLPPSLIPLNTTPTTAAIRVVRRSVAGVQQVSSAGPIHALTRSRRGTATAAAGSGEGVLGEPVISSNRAGRHREFGCSP